MFLTVRPIFLFLRSLVRSNVGSVATSFIEDRNGVLWFSTKGLGIMMYDPRAR
jgi:hypothetical protein